MKSITAILLLVPSLVDAVGLVPEGPHTSEGYDMESIPEAEELCDEIVACAGVTHRAPKDDEEEPTVHFHAFIPPLLEKPDEEGWTTYRSNKTFVYHPGKLESKDILSIDVDTSTLSLTEARDVCARHPECVAFTYPTHSTKLLGFENITFAGSIDSFSNIDGDYWRTLVSTEESKAGRVNATAMIYNENLDNLPYSNCCDRAVLDEETKTPILPTIQDLEKVDTLPRIPCTISRAEFQEKYELTRTPVMLVGCDKEWPAKTKWTIKDLTYRFDNDTLWRAKTHDNMDDYDDETRWQDISEDMANGESFYVFDDLDRQDSARDSLKADYSIPGPFQGADMYADDFPPDLGTLRWFCMGSKHTGTLPHNDPYGSDAWNSLLVGHKWWVLYPREVKRKSYISCDYECTESEFPVDWYMSVAINAARTHYGDGKSPIHILQKPGETIYVPFGMIHSVFNMDETIAITANYGSPGNLEKVWEFVLREGTEEQWKKMYYETFTEEQRKTVREGRVWPPEDFAGESLGEQMGEDEDDFYYSSDDEEYYDEEELGFTPRTDEL